MSHTIKRLGRGGTAKMNLYTGPSGELLMDTDTKELVLHDGVTTGGIRVASKSSVTALDTRVTAIEGGGVIGGGGGIGTISPLPEYIARDDIEGSWLLADGGTVKIADYPELYSILPVFPEIGFRFTEGYNIPDVQISGYSTTYPLSTLISSHRFSQPGMIVKEEYDFVGAAIQFNSKPYVVFSEDWYNFKAVEMPSPFIFNSMYGLLVDYNPTNKTFVFIADNSTSDPNRFYQRRYFVYATYTNNATELTVTHELDMRNDTDTPYAAAEYTYEGWHYLISITGKTTLTSVVLRIDGYNFSTKSTFTKSFLLSDFTASSGYSVYMQSSLIDAGDRVILFVGSKVANRTWLVEALKSAPTEWAVVKNNGTVVSVSNYSSYLRSTSTSYAFFSPQRHGYFKSKTIDYVNGKLILAYPYSSASDPGGVYVSSNKGRTWTRYSLPAVLQATMLITSLVGTIYKNGKYYLVFMWRPDGSTGKKYAISVGITSNFTSWESFTDVYTVNTDSTSTLLSSASDQVSTIVYDNAFVVIEAVSAINTSTASAMAHVVTYKPEGLGSVSIYPRISSNTYGRAYFYSIPIGYFKNDGFGPATFRDYDFLAINYVGSNNSAWHSGNYPYYWMIKEDGSYIPIYGTVSINSSIGPTINGYTGTLFKRAPISSNKNMGVMLPNFAYGAIFSYDVTTEFRLPVVNLRPSSGSSYSYGDGFYDSIATQSRLYPSYWSIKVK